jgi:integrase
MDASASPRRSKLTSEDVAEIRRRVADGERQIALAREFAISSATVSQIVAGETWGERRSSTSGSEMRRRLIAAFDLGLRAGEMLKIQRQHVVYGGPDEVWAIRLPADITKAGKDQIVFVGSDRLKAELEKRRFLKADDYVFGDQAGRPVASFDKSWKRLFKLAGLPVGRKDGLVWHDLRHEYGSFLIEQGATIQEVKEMMRHADISTSATYLTAREERLKALAAKMGKRLA